MHGYQTISCVDPLDCLQQLVHSDLHPENEERIATVDAPATAASLAAKCSSPSSVAQSWGFSHLAAAQPPHGPTLGPTHDGCSGSAGVRRGRGQRR
jgi:hypothetical protein